MNKTVVLVVAALGLTVGAAAQSVTSSPLPLVFIETDFDPVTGQRQAIPDEPKVGATMKIVYTPGAAQNLVADTADTASLHYFGRIGIELRGSTSQDFEKKPYGLETREADDSTNRNVSLLGMPAENDWVLNPLNYDNSYLRDPLAYALAARTGRYAPRTRYCEVFVNGDYRGLYFLTEKIKIDDGRVDLAKMGPADTLPGTVSGGYIVKADKTTGGDSVAWSTPAHDYWEPVDYIYHNPKPAEITPQQEAYIQACFAALQAATDAANASPADGYPSVIDIPSFVDYMIVGELASNVDIYQKSTFFHKERQGKLCAGPVWDFNLAFGNDLGWGMGRSRYDVWQFDNADNTGSEFWYQLFGDSRFRCRLARRWRQLTADDAPLSYASVCTLIDSLQQVADPVVSRDKQRWGYWFSHTYEIASLKQWLSYRYTWIDDQLAACPECDSTALPQLVISHIAYHPDDWQGYTSKQLEFIGISNAGSEAVALTGVYFSHPGLGFCFAPGDIMAAGGVLFLAADTAAFRQAYGLPAFGQFARNLSNSSQHLVLANAWGEVIDSLTYRDRSPWPRAADGDGPFLLLADLAADNALGQNWTTATSLLPEASIATAAEPRLMAGPSPTTGRLAVRTTGGVLGELTLFDVCGRPVAHWHADAEQVLVDLGHLPQGIYYIRASHPSHPTLHAAVVVKGGK